jgi:alpha-beta hydrolase superfamily lysophospholipase
MVGMKKIELKLYPGDRHELLNETDKQEVYQDIVRWMEMILSPADQ